VWRPGRRGIYQATATNPEDGPVLKLLLLIALVAVVVMFVVPALRRRG
jgi:hypothetical protein